MIETEEKTIGYVAVCQLNGTRVEEFALLTSPEREEAAAEAKKEIEAGLKRMEGREPPSNFDDVSTLLLVMAFFKNEWDRMQAFALAIHKHTGDRFMVIGTTMVMVENEPMISNMVWTAHAPDLEAGKEAIMGHEVVQRVKQQATDGGFIGKPN